MLRAAVWFFIMGLLVFFLGVNGLAGVSPEIGRGILMLFLIFSLISFVGEITTGKTRDRISS